MSAERASTIRLGITTGDYNGVGPEVIMKTFADRRILEYVTPIIYGSSRLFSYWKKALDLNEFQ
jgi:4-hydroxythreonine-4-phosphate dehydrogenase